MDIQVKASRILRAACALALCFLLTGCIMFPINHSRTAAGPHIGKDFDFIRVGRTDRATITNRLGRFDGYYEDLDVGYYAIHHVSATVLWVALPCIPVGTRSWDGGLDVAMIQFDENDRVRRIETYLEWNPEYALRDRAEKWNKPESKMSTAR